jgi:hypothetical protein
MNWFRSIVRSGLLPTDEYQKKRAILLSNYISLLLCGCLLLLFIIRRFVFGHISGGVTVHFLIVGFILFLIPVVLNRLQLTTLSRMHLCFAPVCFIWYVNISLMNDVPVVEQAHYDSVRIHLLAVSFIPYLLLNEKKRYLLIFGILPTLTSLVLFDWILSQFGVGINQKGVPSQEAALIGMRTFIAYCVTSISCFIFQSIITYNDLLNERILSELKLKSEQIKSQNEELIQSKEHLNEMNRHLEDLVSKKTEAIKAQNEKILKYAHSNAHHVRGPVARLLGLIQLSKLETDLDYRWFFEKVEDSAKEVDTIIIGISKELDEIDHQNATIRSDSDQLGPSA